MMGNLIELVVLTLFIISIIRELLRKNGKSKKREPETEDSSASNSSADESSTERSSVEESSVEESSVEESSVEESSVEESSVEESSVEESAVKESSTEESSKADSSEAEKARGLLSIDSIKASTTEFFRGKTKKDYARLALRFALQISLLALALYVFFPRHFSEFVYGILFLKIFLVVPLLILFAGVMSAGLLAIRDKKPLAVVVGMFTVIAVAAAYVVVSYGNRWQTASRYEFQRQLALPEFDPQMTRFTPFDVAFNDMVQNLASSEFTIEKGNMHAVDLDGSIGFVVPITPEGVIGTLAWKQDGFMVFHDGPGPEDMKRARRIKQPFTVGQGMLFMDDIWRTLYLRDPFCEYPEIYYLQLDKSQPDKFVAVAPKVRYSYKFPCFFVPYWAGVTLVHDDGKVETLTPEEAQKDPRLLNKRLYPESLARKIVESQSFDRGFFSGLYQRPGLIRIPTLPGNQQMPYLTRTKDGRDLYVVATEPAGSSFALFRMYFVDASTGARGVVEYDVSKGMLGPARAGERVKSLPGYVWETTHDILESVPIIKNGALFWKYTVSTRSRTGVVLTAVVNATSNDITVFSTREQYLAWCSGKDIPQHEPGLTDEIEETRKLLREALERLDRLEQRQSAQPPSTK